jgi:hypothetical protein
VPNPFAGGTRLRFALPSRETVTLRVYDVAGRVVATLLDRATLEPGAHEVPFDGGRLPAGVYLARLTTGGVSETRRIVVAR